MTPLSEKVEEGFGLSEIAPASAPTEAASEGATRGGRRGGRPKKPPSERRRHKYLVSANDAERKAIESAAEATGLAPSAYLREVGVGGGSGGRIERRAGEVVYHRLSRIGVRLQALARRVSEQEQAEELEALVREVVELRSKL
ncbi:MAG: hypothetical protein ABJF88_11745 [Rhodothermales bacterium]